MKAVVTLGKYFGPKHPRKGQETGFIAKVADGRKVHTCRSNYGYWRAKIEKITATGGVLSVRQWSAKPYRSPQEVITEIPAGIVGVQRLALRRERRVINHYAEEQDKPIVYCHLLRLYGRGRRPPRPPGDFSRKRRAYGRRF